MKISRIVKCVASIGLLAVWGVRLGLGADVVTPPGSGVVAEPEQQAVSLANPKFGYVSIYDGSVGFPTTAPKPWPHEDAGFILNDAVNSAIYTVSEIVTVADLTYLGESQISGKTYYSYSENGTNKKWYFIKDPVDPGFPELFFIQQRVGLGPTKGYAWAVRKAIP